MLSEQWLVCGARARSDPLPSGAFQAPGEGDAGSAGWPGGAAGHLALAGSGAVLAVQPPPVTAFRELGALLEADEEGQAYELWAPPA